MTDPQFLFVAEYPCEEFCRVEVDLSEVGNLRFTFAQMQRRAEDEHKRQHRQPDGAAAPKFQPASTL